MIENGKKRVKTWPEFCDEWHKAREADSDPGDQIKALRRYMDTPPKVERAPMTAAEAKALREKHLAESAKQEAENEAEWINESVDVVLRDISAYGRHRRWIEAGYAKDRDWSRWAQWESVLLGLGYVVTYEADTARTWQDLYAVVTLP